MVVAVLGGPPQHALLRRALGENSENELEGSAAREGAVREVAVVPRCDGEDPQPINGDADDHRLKRHAGPERGQTRDMNERERNGGGIDYVVVLVAALGLT